MPTTTKHLALLNWANVLAFILTVLVNGLAGSTTILGGKNTAQISDTYPTLITPAGYVFSIWGIIYIMLGVFVVYQTFTSARGKEFQRRIGWLFVLSCLVNVAWLFLWQFEYLGLSVILMFLLLATLTFIYLRLDIGKSKVSTTEKLVVHLPFSVYLGWITIASIANVAVTLVSVNWGGFGLDSLVWSTLVIIVALFITLIVLATRKDVAYALVIIWALVGISVKQSENQTVVMLTQMSAVIIAITLVAVIFLVTIKRK